MNTSFKVARNAFLSALQTVSPAVNSKSNIPALTYILCELKENTLCLTGNNSEIQITTSLGVVGTTANLDFCIEKQVIDSLKTLPEQPLAINVDNSNLSITHSSGEFKLFVVSHSDYPKMKPADAEPAVFMLSCSELTTGLSKTYKSMASDELRPVMNGVFFDIAVDSITFVATNGHCLSRFVNKSFSTQEPLCFILPSLPVNIILKLLQGIDHDYKISIDCSGSFVHFDLDGISVTSRLIEGRYPNYNSVIPENNPICLTAYGKLICDIINRLLVLSSSTTRLVIIDAKDSGTVFYAEDIDYSQSAKEITGLSTTGGDIKIGIRGNFLLDLISILNDDIKITFSDPSKAIIITPDVQNENTELTLLLMPLLINN